MHLRTAAAAGLLVLLAGSAALPPASSAPGSAGPTVVIHDGRDPGLPASSDLLGLRVHDGPRVLRAVLRLGVLRPGRTSAYLILENRNEGGYTVGTEATGDGGHHPVLAHFVAEGAARRHCAGLLVALDRASDLVRIRVPQRCLTAGTGPRLRVEGLTEEPGSGSDEDDTSSAVVVRG